ncbi:MAG: glycosyltransferase family 39 protein [Candidatus Sumerlaeia bacterium]|nr:glycosyltransferase family 39 protein [Candidatus Sumerlaeia bacterium]
MQNTSLKYLAILLFFACVYTLIVSLNWNEGYIDFGDGNYLYISSRLVDGLVLYRDIMAPQPPIHLYLGYLIQKFARSVGFEPLYTVRLFSLVLHLATFALIYLLARRIFNCINTATLSAIIYLFIPIGFWWSLGYQSEPTEIFFLLLGLYFFLHQQSFSLIFSALFGVLAVFTNMTAAPYVLFTGFYAVVRHRSLWIYYITALIILLICGMLLAEALTGAYFQNVIFNQVGTFPKKELSQESLLNYALRKIINEGKDVLVWEGGIILLAILGLLHFIRHSPHPLKEYIAWYSFFSLCSIIFVSKGGTMDYIFTLGEPYVALFAGYFIVFLWSQISPFNFSLSTVKRFFQDSLPLLRFFLLLSFLVVTFGIGMKFIVATLKEQTYELPERDVKKVKYYIQKYTQPGDAILSPPFYAFISKRKVVEEYSEIFIWTIKYWNERLVFKTPGEGVRKVENIARAINDKKLPLIILDLAQTARIPEIRQAIEQCYQPLLEEPFQTLNTRLQFYIPKRE